ncbi:MAG: PilZ domain-containing protein [Gammaproteobacteria bacterium]|nr:PilZ domain-containing protein [Gammaproteobacteria bacterium]
MTKNKRHFPRKEIETEIELSFLEDGARTVIMHDMSQGGVFLKLDNTKHYPMGEMVNLRFKNPLENFEETVKEGVIVRHANDGIAIAFVEIDTF